MKDKLDTVKELTSFLRKRGLWWLVPVVFIFILVGLFILIVGSSPLAPIIYPLF